MAGNSRRPGAIRKPGSKKPRSVGSGGERRRALEGKGPTPKAVDRTGHVAKRRAAAARAAETAGSRVATGARRGTRPKQAGQRDKATDLVLGRNPVVEALDAGIPAVALFVQRGIELDQRVAVALSHATRLRIPVNEVSKPDLDGRAGGLPHQGLVLQTAPFTYAAFDELLRAAQAARRNLVALDGVTDPRNLGAIVRSAAAFGAAGVVIPSRRSASVTPVVWRASAGTVARVPVAMITNLARSITAAKAAGFTVVGLDAAGPTDLSEVDSTALPVMLVVGGEGKGLGRLVGETCDLLARIDMVGPAESLNASVAAGIALHSLAR